MRRSLIIAGCVVVAALIGGIAGIESSEHGIDDRRATLTIPVPHDEVTYVTTTDNSIADNVSSDRDGYRWPDEDLDAVNDGSTADGGHADGIDTDARSNESTH